MGGGLGLDPRPFSLRQLAWMIEGRAGTRRRGKVHVGLSEFGAAIGAKRRS